MFDAPRAWSGDDDRSVGHCSLPLPATAGKYRPDHHRPGKWNPQDAAGSMKREGPAGSRHAGEPVAKLDPWRWSPAAPCPRAVRSCDHATYCVSFAPELGSADGADSGWACSGWEESPGGIATADGSPCGWPARAWAASAAAAAAANSSGVGSTRASHSCLSCPKVRKGTLPERASFESGGGGGLGREGREGPRWP